MRAVIHVIIFLTINKKQEWKKKDMMKRERKQVTIYKVSKIFIKTLLLIMMAMTVGMFAPIGARAADQTITTNTKTSKLIDLGMEADDTLFVDGTVTVTLTVDEPLTIKCIVATDSNLTINGNAGLTLNAGDSKAIIANELSIVDCSINATTNSFEAIYALNSLYIDNSKVTANSQNTGIMSSTGDISITNNSLVNASAYYGIHCFGGNLSISGAGTQVFAEGTQYAMAGGHGISLNDGLEIIEPAGGVIKKNFFYFIMKSNETTEATKVTIKNPNYVPPTVNNPNSGQKVSSNTSSHTHSYSWVVTKSPTSTSDGEEAYMCSCGEIERTSILPAISAFEEETINKIKNAPANAVVEVETSLFNSFGIGVRDALAARPDVTLKVSFLEGGYRGQRLKLTIPAGKDRDKHWDENGWLGLCRAGTIFGYDQ